MAFQTLQSHINRTALREAIMNFQSYFGLDQTGMYMLGVISFSAAEAL